MDKQEAVMNMIEQYGQIDGGHHKAWVLDQIARIIKGDKYEHWVKQMKAGEDGLDTYSYDEGIPP